MISGNIFLLKAICFSVMGIGGDILKGIAKEVTRDITRDFDEALIESVKEGKRNEASLAASKSAKERGLSAEEAKVEIDLSQKAVEEEMRESQLKANKFFTRIGVLLIGIMFAFIYSQ